MSQDPLLLLMLGTGFLITENEVFPENALPNQSRPFGKGHQVVDLFRERPLQDA